uniref:Uncharacterized protein n=1 Tax=Magallana gigas TaxID=29159 RepID=K1QZC9_MAGGI
MYDADGTGKVFRYNKSGQLTQTIQYENTELELYRQPNYVTENNNGDVVVSDYESAVVVTDRGGRRRFSYTGHPPGSNLGPLGICTDAMSHILMNTHPVPMGKACPAQHKPCKNKKKTVVCSTDIQTDKKTDNN